MCLPKAHVSNHLDPGVLYHSVASSSSFQPAKSAISLTTTIPFLLLMLSLSKLPTATAFLCRETQNSLKLLGAALCVFPGRQPDFSGLGSCQGSVCVPRTSCHTWCCPTSRGSDSVFGHSWEKMSDSLQQRQFVLNPLHGA